MAKLLSREEVVDMRNARVAKSIVAEDQRKAKASNYQAQLRAVISYKKAAYVERGNEERAANVVKMVIHYKLTDGVASCITRQPESWPVKRGFTTVPDDGGDLSVERFSVKQ